MPPKSPAATSVCRTPIPSPRNPIATSHRGIRLVETIQSRLVTRPSTSRGTSWCSIVPQITWPSAIPVPATKPSATSSATFPAMP